MIIVSGWIRVDAALREEYLDGCRAAVEAARGAPGCVDFHLSADPLDSQRINIFEQWESVEAVETFRGSGPTGNQESMIIGAHVEQHDIANTVSLT